MKKIIIPIIILIILLIIGTIFWIYKENEENKRIDAEAITLKENLTVEFGKKVKTSDFIEKINGTLISDNEINTEELGEKLISFEFKNIKNKKRKREFTIKIVDINAPKIFIGNSHTVTVRI